MKELFSPVWVVCLDESMSPWTNRFTCLGWVFCPRKPYPEGNEYHTICCGVTGILFDLELREGKDRPSELPAEEFSEEGKTAGLLLRLTKTIHHTARYVVLDSGFCVLMALLALKKKGVYGGEVIKKQHFWSSLVARDAMDCHFEDKEVGAVAAVEGNHAGVCYIIWSMKDAGYITKIMGTAPGLYF